MIVRCWDALPRTMRVDAVRPYYNYLRSKPLQLCAKRAFDVVASGTLILLLLPAMAVMALLILLQDGRPVFFKQQRITTYGRAFRIVKFRTMVKNAQKLGPQVTAENDTRITPIGKRLRDRRLDEIPQLFNILIGDMSFVGTRPEVSYFVAAYSDEMMATLLLPAGLTSMASIEFKDEDQLQMRYPGLSSDDIYIRHILPKKMATNLQALSTFSLLSDLKVLFLTLRSVLLHK